MFPIFKVRLMVQSGQQEGRSVREVARDIIKRHGVLGLYRGVLPELVRGTMYQCWLTGTKEGLQGMNYRMLLSLMGSG